MKDLKRYDVMGFDSYKESDSGFWVKAHEVNELLNGFHLSSEEILEVIRLSYLAGVTDEQELNGRWCKQGSLERAEDLVEEFKEEKLI